jgi:hypothetical protein
MASDYNDAPVGHPDYGKRFFEGKVQLPIGDRFAAMAYMYAVQPGESEDIVDHLAFAKLIAPRIKGYEHLATLEPAYEITRSAFLSIGSGFRYETRPPKI